MALLNDVPELPELVPGHGPGWVLEIEGFDPEKLRVNASLFALADGRFGANGAPLAAREGTHRWVLAGGIYVLDGPETHLLTAPIALQLPFEMAAEPHLRRALDLHSGVLYEEVDTTQGPLTSVRFCSLARPGVMALRAVCQVAQGDPLDPVAAALGVTQLPADVTRLAPGPQRPVASGPWVHRPRRQQEGRRRARVPAA